MAGSEERVDVAVVGGGPAGTVLATLLTAQGRRVVVLERGNRGVLAVGTGILLQPNGLSVLYGLGLRDPLAAVSVSHRAVPIKDEHGRLITTGQMPDFGDGLDHVLALLRPTMQDLLWGALADQGGGVDFGCEVRNVDTVAGELTVSDHGTIRRIRADLIVGADGIGSVVRRAGRFGARPIKGAHPVFRAVADGDFNVSGAEYWTELGLFGASPAGSGKTYAYGSANDQRVHAAASAGDLDRLADLWSTALPSSAPLMDQIRTTDTLLLNEVGRVRCRRYHADRAVLVGDAAHAMAPNLGQGANSALVDAAVLAREITDAPTISDALRHYDRIRRRPVTRVQRTSDLLATISHLQHPQLRRLRDSAFRTAGRPTLVNHQIRATQQIEPGHLLRDVGRLAST